jgi:hypothetical protein
MTWMEVSESGSEPAFVVLVRVGVRIDRPWESEGKTDPTMLGSCHRACQPHPGETEHST